MTSTGGNIVEKSGGERKVWSIISAVPCPHTPMHVWVVQEHIGSWVVINGIEDYREEDKPFPHRLVYMKMDEDGKLSNVHSSYKGPHLYK